MNWLSGAAQRIIEILSDPKLLIALFLFSLALLTLPEPVIGWFGLTRIVNEGRGWISLLLFLCIAGLFAHVLIHGAHAIQDRRAARKQQPECTKDLGNGPIHFFSDVSVRRVHAVHGKERHVATQGNTWNHLVHSVRNRTPGNGAGGNKHGLWAARSGPVRFAAPIGAI